MKAELIGMPCRGSWHPTNHYPRGGPPWVCRALGEAENVIKSMLLEANAAALGVLLAAGMWC